MHVSKKKKAGLEYTCEWCGHTVLVGDWIHLVHGKDAVTGIRFKEMPMHTECVEKGFNLREEGGYANNWHLLRRMFQYGTNKIVEQVDEIKRLESIQKGYDYLAKLGIQRKSS